jgi:site-specific DNA-methyltransferase (adenine-specific)
VENMEIKLIDPKSIIPYENNPRKNDKAVKPVMESIQQFGFNVPITVDKNMVVVTGHTRLRAALKLKMTEVPIIMLEGLDDEKIKAFRLADNKLSELADWDIQKLIEEIQGIELDMTLFGFKDEKSIKEVTGDEQKIVIPKNPTSKYGDVFQLGRHRLMCGDATVKEDIKILLDGSKIDCTITDPPYNVDYNASKNRNKIKNDNLSNNDFLIFLTKAFINIEENIKKGGSYYIFCADRSEIEFRTAIIKSGLENKQTLIWVKDQFVFGRSDYHWQHEPCLYGWKPGAAHYFIEDHTLSTILNFNRTKINDDHPTIKPVKLIAHLMQNSSNPNENILDLFGGSGTTLIVAEQMNRICYMCELDPRYVDVIIKRWEEMTKQKAVKIINSETMGG